MSERSGTVESFVCHLVAALAPLRRAVSDEDAFKAFMLRLGWESAGLPPAYTAIGNCIAEAAAAADALSAEPTPAEIALLLEKASAAYEKITSIDSAPPGVDAAAFLAEIGERLFEILLTDYLASEQPALFNLLSILNVIEQQDFPASAAKRAHARTHFKWQEIPKIVREPMTLAERVYGWGTPQLRFQLLVQHVGEFLFDLGFPVFIGQADELLADGYREDDDFTPDHSWLLKLPFYYITIAEKNLEAAFTLMELRGGNGKLPGIIIQPELPEEFPLRFQIAPDIDLRLRRHECRLAVWDSHPPGRRVDQVPFRAGETAAGRRHRCWARFQSDCADSALRRAQGDPSRVSGRVAGLRRANERGRVGCSL